MANNKNIKAEQKENKEDVSNTDRSDGFYDDIDYADVPGMSAFNGLIPTPGN